MEESGDVRLSGQSRRLTLTTAAVPAALVPKYPGQNSPNPCICLAGFCSGTFSLRSGCYIIAGFLVVRLL